MWARLRRAEAWLIVAQSFGSGWRLTHLAVQLERRRPPRGERLPLQPRMSYSRRIPPKGMAHDGGLRVPALLRSPSAFCMYRFVAVQTRVAELGQRCSRMNSTCTLSCRLPKSRTGRPDDRQLAASRRGTDHVPPDIGAGIAVAQRSDAGWLVGNGRARRGKRRRRLCDQSYDA